MLGVLRRAYAKTEFIHHPWWEQPAMFDALRESQDAPRVRIVPRRLFNSFAAEHRPSHFMVHFAGWPHAAKVEGVNRAIRGAYGP
jgi:hypothetical protein